MVVFDNSMISTDTLGILEVNEFIIEDIDKIAEGENRFVPFSPSIYDSHFNTGEVMSLTGLSDKIGETTIHTALGYIFTVPSSTLLDKAKVRGPLNIAGKLAVGDHVLIAGNAYDAVGQVPLKYGPSETEYFSNELAQLIALTMLYGSYEDETEEQKSIKIIGTFKVEANLFLFLSKIGAVLLEGSNNINVIRIKDDKWCSIIAHFTDSLRRVYLMLNKSPKDVVCGFLLHIIEFIYRTGTCPVKLSFLIQHNLLTKYGLVVKLTDIGGLETKFDFFRSMEDLIEIIKLGSAERFSLLDINPKLKDDMIEYKKGMLYLYRDEIVKVDTAMRKGYELIIEPNLVFNTICGLF